MRDVERNASEKRSDFEDFIRHYSVSANEKTYSMRYEITYD
ncbi:hypothetical protein RBH29_17440 [Herbivorax sp. ANBcel31]|nr:hypothetical protein [Herbivorax sp. ANBcel31]MDQ2088210.1 hypothetical protein [Herbivorax sp. ANBcel31]